MARNEYDKFAEKLIDQFSDERVTIDDMEWIPMFVILNAYPTSVLDKIEIFCHKLIEKRQEMCHGN